MSTQPAVTEATAPRQALAALYEPDEVAWLDETVRLIRAGQLDELDYENLASYLEGMSISERREISNRLKTLLAHLLKWHYQPEYRSTSWRLTIYNQRDDILNEFTATLRRYAEDRLADCYTRAVLRATLETGLKKGAFPRKCPFTLDQVLTDELP